MWMWMWMWSRCRTSIFGLFNIAVVVAIPPSHIAHRTVPPLRFCIRVLFGQKLDKTEMCYTLCNGFGFHSHNIILWRYLLLPSALSIVLMIFSIRWFSFRCNALCHAFALHPLYCCYTAAARCLCLIRPQFIMYSICGRRILVAFVKHKLTHTHIHTHSKECTDRLNCRCLACGFCVHRSNHTQGNVVSARCWQRRQTNRTSENTLLAPSHARQAKQMNREEEGKRRTAAYTRKAVNTVRKV